MQTVPTRQKIRTRQSRTAKHLLESLESRILYSIHGTASLIARTHHQHRHAPIQTSIAVRPVTPLAGALSSSVITDAPLNSPNVITDAPLISITTDSPVISRVLTDTRTVSSRVLLDAPIASPSVIVDTPLPAAVVASEVTDTPPAPSRVIIDAPLVPPAVIVDSPAAPVVLNTLPADSVPSVVTDAPIDTPASVITDALPSSPNVVTDSPILDVINNPAGASPSVVGRYVYYAGSYIGDALATNKSVLLPGAAATAANVTSYSGGINEIVMDVANSATSYNAGNFTFRMGQSGDPSTWTNAPAPLLITALAGLGVDGSTRIFMRWADGLIKNQWLQVSFLPANDTFYLGNLVADTGAFQVTQSTESAVRAASTSLLSPTGITNAYDFNRDGKVDAIDQLIARAANGARLTAFTAPGGAAPPTSYDWHTQMINGALNIWAPNPSDFGATFTVTDPTMLFGTDGVPQVQGVHQGPTADCYFLAAGGSLAFTNPSRLQALIKNDAGGGWSVTFQYYNQDTGIYSPVVIHTSNQLSSVLQAISNNEVWSMVLEKAYAAFRTWNGYSSLDTMASLGWGFGGTALTALGDANTSLYIGSMSQATLYATLQTNLAANLPLLYHTASSAPTMVQAHVYIITGVSTDGNGTRWITMYNPWGFFDTRTEADFLANGQGTIVVGTA